MENFADRCQHNKSNGKKQVSCCSSLFSTWLSVYTGSELYTFLHEESESEVQRLEILDPDLEIQESNPKEDRLKPVDPV